MQILKGHTDRVRRVTFSPDGATLASGGEDGTVLLWDLVKGRKRETQRVRQRHRPSTAYDVAFAPDGSRVASAWSDGRVRLLSLVDGAGQVLSEGHGVLVTSVAFAPDGSALLSGSGNASGKVVLHDAKTWEVAWSTAEIVGGVWCVGFGGVGRYVAIGKGGLSPAILLWRPHQVKHFAVLSASEGVRFLEFSPDGENLAAATGRTVALWGLGSLIVPARNSPRRAATVSPSWTVTTHAERIRGLAFAPDGRMVATASDDGTVRLWDAADGSERACFDWGVGRVGTVAFSPDGMTLATGGEREIIIWDSDERA